MNKRELIQALEKYPDDFRVVVSGYEGGLGDIGVGEVLIVLDVHDEWYYGPHEVFCPVEHKDKDVCQAIVIYEKAG